MNILIIIFRNIGDTLLASALIDNLSCIYKDAKISVALNANTQAALKGNPNIHKIYSYDRSLAKSRGLIMRVVYEVGYFRGVLSDKYDMVFNLTSGDRGAYLALLSGAKVRVGFDKSLISRAVFNKIAQRKTEHTVERYLRFLEAIGERARIKSVSFCSDANYEPPLKRFVHIHPVSRWLFKCLDDDLMAFIVDYIKEEFDLDAIVTASDEKNELQKVESIISKTKHAPINLAGKLSLAEVGALNRQAVAFVGVDTAIMHISAANDTPTFAFFGPSGAFHWGPWQNGAESSGYTQNSGIQKMGKHTVFQESWECIPCGKDGCDGSKISRCLIELDREMIKRELSEFFRGIDDKHFRA